LGKERPRRARVHAPEDTAAAIVGGEPHGAAAIAHVGGLRADRHKASFPFPSVLAAPPRSTAWWNSLPSFPTLGQRRATSSTSRDAKSLASRGRPRLPIFQRVERAGASREFNGRLSNIDRGTSRQFGVPRGAYVGGGGFSISYVMALSWFRAR